MTTRKARVVRAGGFDGCALHFDGCTGTADVHPDYLDHMSTACHNCHEKVWHEMDQEAVEAQGGEAGGREGL